MASRRLHLYANGNNTSDDNFNFDGNITLDCISNCVGICVYGVCFPSPPSSPASLPNDNSTYVTLPINVHRSDRLTPTLIITAVSAVAGCFALLLALYACFRFRRRRRRRRHPPAREDAADALNRDEIDGDFVPGGEIEHHIWYIRTQGLDDSTISSITSWIYRSSDGLIDGKDCSVCLGEFYEGDLVRLLPKCSHAFHLSCIDRWLRSHINCPLCRAPIVPPGAAAAAPAPSPASPGTAFIADLVEPIVGSPVPVESTQVEAFPSANIGDEIEIVVVIDRSQEETSSGSPVLLELLPNSSEDEDNLQPIRRSISMDAFPLGVLGGAEEEEMPSANGDKPRGFYLKRNLRRKFHSKIGRPLSSQSARWFYPRYARPQNTILPL